MVLLLPSPVPRAPYGAAAASTSSPLSTFLRPRRHPLAGVRCCARRTPPPAAVGEEAAASWAAAVPWKATVSGALALTLSISCFVGLANAKAGVNKPELLPKEFTTVIDVAGFLSSGQENRLRQEIQDLEKDTGYKLRVLAQNYPDTPGLAIKDFWQVDDRTIVFVADPTFGNIINFNIGSLIDLDIPQSFWSRVAGKYGNMFYWKEKGEDASIEGAVTAISRCLREPTGPSNCSEVF
ncbi:thylakoid lumenal 15.0 kDa protein 2, chloroplastic-like [Lolium rigidum]|uniref:thylakoid lumenal 15.0 kDa protein 2, chloroplastic-like n=1 Tax=Lolium rigidum TaxID=89674 RepID=UPI001F5DD60E|nr:thylakoid lumenal 15.0 kDa protein 2, chloroplastic-like [Lolium rigidum]XP_051213178.1 thylakoid lumenal 15.0 kDa protein 2, chloroplastic isoform X2 [Lolium perenne]